MQRRWVKPKLDIFINGVELLNDGTGLEMRDISTKENKKKNK